MKVTKKYTFDSALRRVLSVSKADLERMLAAQKKEKPAKPKARRSDSGRVSGASNA